MEIRKVGDAYKEQGIKAILYGQSGTGKTYSIVTLPEKENTLILSAEAGLMSIKDVGKDLDVVVINGMDDLRGAFSFLNGDTKYTTVVLDSLTEIAEQVLGDEKKKCNDPRKAYGELQNIMVSLIKSFRDLKGKNVLFLCKAERTANDDGIQLYAPSMPGNKLSQAIPYLTDLVFAMRIKEGEDGSMIRAFMTQPDLQYSAKDRSGTLGQFETPDWSVIFEKINSK